MSLEKNKKPNQIERSWYVVDAKKYVLGRLTTKVAQVLQGKHKPYYSPQWDLGDYVVVVNSAQVRATGNKDEQKQYYRHTGFPGGIRSKSLAEMREQKPNDIIRLAVKGMLPKNRLAKEMIKKLHIYEGSEHPHEAQNPQTLEIK